MRCRAFYHAFFTARRCLAVHLPVVIYLCLAGWISPSSQAADPEVDFARDVQPLFAKYCMECHGSEKQESGFRLDDRDAAFLGGDSGRAIVAGDSASSRLIQYVAGSDPDYLMPPDGKRLTAEEVALLSRWVDRGAIWPASPQSSLPKNNHWAYQPLLQITPPELQHNDFVRNPIDQFILAKLQAKNLEPSAEADKPTLIRRLSLDLLGLLPAIEEVNAFVENTSPTAYEDLVDRLLDSPHFGERWGRHWLDMARYADSDGYEKDNPRPDAYRYRDWVIDAINQDLPFDQFTIEQLAGDLLPNASDMQRLATAFHRQTLTNTEGGTDQEQFRIEACFDRTETTGAVWLGLTVGCARCHTHKYDAITQREYYQLFSFFNNGDEQTHVVPKSTSEVRAYEMAKEEHERKVAIVRQELELAKQQLGPALSAWETETRATLAAIAARPLNRQGLNQLSVTSLSSATFTPQKDGSILVGGDNPDTNIYTLTGEVTADFDTLRLDVLADKSLPAKGPGRVAHGNFVLSEVTIEVADTADFRDAKKLEFAGAKADHEQGGDKPWRAVDTIDGDLQTGWAVGPEYGKNHWIELQLKQPVSIDSSRFVRLQLIQNYGKQHTIGRFKVAVQTGTENDLKLPKNITAIVKKAASERNEAESAALLEYFSQVDPSTKKFHEQLAALEKQAPPKPELTVRVLAQRTQNPRETYVLRRGEFLEPLKDVRVDAGGFSTLPKLQSRHRGAAADRLDLANWLVSRENPITPRVTVNHVWRRLLGAGLVKTLNDFGVRGDPPTHPELLDWLAAEFIGLYPQTDSSISAWSRKSLIKLIVMSGTYRQSSRLRPELLELDPQNQWLARQNRIRVEGEIVRDISLDAAGLLSRKMGGPSVYPHLPSGVAELSYAGNFKWTLSAGEDQYRRGMYTFFKRTAPHPNLITFDCPDANLACIDRNTSNTPLQALVALNNASFAESARGLAKRVLTMSDANDDATRMTIAFRLCLARTPSEFELDQLLDLLSGSRTWYANHTEQAKQLVDHFAVEGFAIEENAAWVATARILINLDEFITRD